jgi:hypothetical protein
MTITVVPLRETPPLTDVIAHIRAFADRLEAGEYGEADTVFVVMPMRNDFPKVFGWGDITGINEPIVQFEMAKHWLIANLVERIP